MAGRSPEGPRWVESRFGILGGHRACMHDNEFGWAAHVPIIPAGGTLSRATASWTALSNTSPVPGSFVR